MVSVIATIAGIYAFMYKCTQINLNIHAGNSMYMHVCMYVYMYIVRGLCINRLQALNRYVPRAVRAFEVCRVM